MRQDVYVNNDRVYVGPRNAIGKGGEADVFNIGGGLALKLFKPPDHPDFEDSPLEQLGARERIQTHQTKLKEFPQNMPSRVIKPIDLAYDQYGYKVLGYTMRFLQSADVLKRYSEQLFRQAINNNDIITIFSDLYQTLKGIHVENVVIGDFNDLNVLVQDNRTYIVDADSMQFGKYYCKVFTAKFVDPLLCDKNANSLQLVRPHNKDSDWYAFTVMLMQCLLFVDPYGGIYRPKLAINRMPHGQRPLHRITVFNPEVQYPKPALPYKLLPDDLLDFFRKTFEKDWRNPLPIKYLENLRWTKCANCGTMHARSICPMCTKPLPEMIKQKVTIRGVVTATKVFGTTGQIIFATQQNGKLFWLYQQDQKLVRETGITLQNIQLDPKMRFRIQGDKTVIGKGNQLTTFTANGQYEQHVPVDTYGTLTSFDANDSNTFWLQSGQLLKSSALGSEYVGDVLKDQTLFWVGPNFGFGFYRAASLSVAFVFGTKLRGINDQIKLTSLKGQLVDSTCFFAKNKVWFFVSVKSGSKIVNHCTVIRVDGTIEATANADEGEDSWLGTIRGKCAAGDFLLAATDDGIVRIEVANNQLIVTRNFPDTEPFVSSGSHLFPGSDGIYAVSQKEITLLQIKT